MTIVIKQNPETGLYTVRIDDKTIECSLTLDEAIRYITAKDEELEGELV